jgi:lipopolysaccharide export system permease protein
MTFGNLGESFELVAIKSAGIPLLRFMRPLLIIAVLFTGVAFIFANNLIPVSQLKLNALKYDIIVKKPAFDLKEGVFFDKIEGYVIKVGKKEKDDSTIRNVVIYEKNNGLQDNFLVAESGTMKVTKDNFLEFKLHNGWNYQEEGGRYNPTTDFTRFGFKDYLKEFDLRSFKMNRTEDSLFRYDPKMYTIGQLVRAIDSMGDIHKQYYQQTSRSLSPFLRFIKYADSSWPASSTAHVVKNAKSFDQFIPDSIKSSVYDIGLTDISITKSNIDIMARDYIGKRDLIRAHWIELHRKLTLSIACIVLFMIGAPLGSIIRKGGLGAPLVFAIIFFVLFHLLNTFGEKFAKQGVTNVLIGMWLSTLFLIPIGAFLTVKAMHDSQLFNKEFYYRFFRSVKRLLTRLRLLKTST